MPLSEFIGAFDSSPPPVVSAGGLLCENTPLRFPIGACYPNKPAPLAFYPKSFGYSAFFSGSSTFFSGSFVSAGFYPPNIVPGAPPPNGFDAYCCGLALRLNGLAAVWLPPAANYEVPPAPKSEPVVPPPNAGAVVFVLCPKLMAPDAPNGPPGC